MQARGVDEADTLARRSARRTAQTTANTTAQTTADHLVKNTAEKNILHPGRSVVLALAKRTDQTPIPWHTTSVIRELTGMMDRSGGVHLGHLFGYEVHTGAKGSASRPVPIVAIGSGGDSACNLACDFIGYLETTIPATTKSARGSVIGSGLLSTRGLYAVSEPLAARYPV